MKWIDGDKLLFRLEQYRKFVEQVEDNYLALMVFNSVEREIKKLEEEGIEKCKSCKEMARLWTWPGDTKHGYWTKVGDNWDRLYDFLYDNDINDLHYGNVGYIDGSLVYIDFSGYREW